MKWLRTSQASQFQVNDHFNRCISIELLTLQFEIQAATKGMLTRSWPLMLHVCILCVQVLRNWFIVL